MNPYSIPFHSASEAEAGTFLREIVTQALPLIEDPEILEAAAAFLVTGCADVAHAPVFRFHTRTHSVGSEVLDVLYAHYQYGHAVHVGGYTKLDQSYRLEVHCEYLIKRINEHSSSNP